MTESREIEPQGEDRFVVRLPLREETAETWSNLSPDVLDDVGVGAEAEEGLVRTTVAYLLQHQELADFPHVVELEDVISTYDDHLDSVRSSTGR